MTLYYICIGSLIAGSVTKTPILKAIPTVLALTAACYPKAIPLGLTKHYTEPEKTKLESICKLANEACQNLGIKNSTKINLRVTTQFEDNACAIGSTSSLGGPLLCLGQTFFKNYQATPTNAEEFQDWSAILNEMPNSPNEIGGYLDSCDEEKRKRIFTLVKKYKDFLTTPELESIIAHELGHAKHHHILKALGVYLLLISALEIAKLFANKMGYKTSFDIVSLPIYFLVAKATTMVYENQADNECAMTVKYQEGMLELFKKYLLVDLLEKRSFSYKDKVEHMLRKTEWTSTHPNAAKRFQRAAEMLAHPIPPQTAMTPLSWLLVACGIANLARLCLVNATELMYGIPK